MYYHIWSIRNGLDEGVHSNEAIELVEEFVKLPVDIPDGCVYSFPFEMIYEMREEYL